MATYKQIQNEVKLNSHFTPKTCWIAHVLSDLGQTKRTAPNRIDPSSRVHPCPPEKRAAILRAIEKLG